ncbi:MAG: serine/threonine protein kinase [Cyanophyceae cyanobacterium]
MELIGDRYSIISKLGQGGSSITYAAVDLKSNEKVAIKALSLTRLENWKKIELFEREAKILQQLNHPAIPKYLDYFEVETETNLYFYIVQQLAYGQSLADSIDQGWRPNEATVKNIAEQVLKILVYLQQLTPPVIHRDIKPQNIIYQPDTNKLFLVDFGSVQDTYHHTVMGSTVVGTYGYMAPEQYRGGAVLSTDLYSLGCTILFLLTGESPADLPQKKLKLDFRKAVKIEQSFADWIDKSIEPDVDSRFPDAEFALLALQEKQTIQGDNSGKVKPQHSSISISQDKQQCIIDIPPAFQRKRLSSSSCWLAWVITSTLNKIAAFLSVSLIFKVYIILGFYAMFLKPDKADSKWEYFFLLLVVWDIAPQFSFSIPLISIFLLLADALIKYSVKDNFVRKLFFRTTILIEDKDYIYSCRFRLTRKDSRGKCIEMVNSNYLSLLQAINLSKTFITAQEQDWVEERMRQFVNQSKF